MTTFPEELTGVLVRYGFTLETLAAAVDDGIEYRRSDDEDEDGENDRAQARTYGHLWDALQGDASAALSRPVVLVSISGDSYGGEATTFPGVGDPIVVTVDSGRYDKFNRQPGDDPLADFADELALLGDDTKAGQTLRRWLEDIS